MFPDPTRPWKDRIVEHLANPMEAQSVSDLCKDLKISRDTYYKFLQKDRETIYKEADRRRRKYMGALRAMGFKALGYRLKKSDKAVQMALEITGDYIPKSEQRIEYTTPEQKKQRIRKLLAGYIQKKDAIQDKEDEQDQG